MGDRVVDCARLESVCAERHRGFESPPIRHLTVASALPRLQIKLQRMKASRRAKWLDRHALDEERSAIVIRATRPQNVRLLEYLFNL